MIKKFSRHEKWLLCRPTQYGVEYEINPWMHINDQPDCRKALSQWEALERTLKGLSVELHSIEHVKGIPDQVFTANGGLVLGTRCVLPFFRYPERQKELPYFKDWFESHEYTTFTPKDGAFEGEGDALFQGDRLFGGYGFRSDLKAYDSIQKFLGFSQLVPMELVNPSFYHLDTCFAPIGPEAALFFPDAFTAESVKRAEKYTQLIAVPPDEAERFCCNCVVVGGEIIMPAGSSRTAALLEREGYKVHQVDLSEFKKAGGAAKCLSLRI